MDGGEREGEPRAGRHAERERDRGGGQRHQRGAPEHFVDRVHQPLASGWKSGCPNFATPNRPISFWVAADVIQSENSCAQSWFAAPLTTITWYGLSRSLPPSTSRSRSRLWVASQ